MKKMFVILVGLVALMQTVQAEDKVLDSSKFEAIKKMNVVLEDPALTIQGVIEQAETYVLKLEAKSPQGSQRITAYLDKSSSNLYIGSAYIKDGHPIFFPKDAAAIKAGVSFSYGTGSKEIYLVTDPECPYCSKFAKAAVSQMTEYTVHVIFFPLSFHKKAPLMVEWIMRGKDNAEKKKRYDDILLSNSTAYTEVKKEANQKSVYSAAVQEKMDKATIASMELNVRGTPMLFDAAFNPVAIDQVLKVPKK